MKHVILALFLATGILACSSDRSTPRIAEPVAPRVAQVDFQDLRIRYNAIPTSALSEAMAAEYQVPRTSDDALVIIALRKVAGDDEIPVEGTVRVRSRDLLGQRQQDIEMRTIRTGDYVDHYGVLRVEAQDTIRFDVMVETEGQTRHFDFQHNF